MRITKGGFAVIDDDTHFSKWIEQTGQIDHGQFIERSFRKWFGEGDTVIDVGACLGDHTVPYAQIVGDKGQVFAFEPNQEAYECLIHNTQNYPQIKCFNFGLSDIEKDLGFVRHSNLGASYLTDDGSAKVKVKPLNSITNLFDLTKVKFIKIDVEGWELNVLNGCKEMITQSKPIIMIEIAACHQERYGNTPIDIYKWLKDNGYNVGEVLNEPQYDLVVYPNMS